MTHIIINNNVPMTILLFRTSYGYWLRISMKNHYEMHENFIDQCFNLSQIKFALKLRADVMKYILIKVNLKCSVSTGKWI